MNIVHLIVSSVSLVALLTQQTRAQHSAFIIVLDRSTNEVIPAEVYIGAHQTRTEQGKATFYKVDEGKYRLVIIADDDQYPIVNWTITVPQTETAVYRLEKR